MAAIEKSLMEDAHPNEYSCLLSALADEVADEQAPNVQAGCPLAAEASAVSDKIAAALSPEPVDCTSTVEAYVSKIGELKEHLKNTKDLST